MDPVPLKRVADQSGFPLARLSKLAIAGCFPSQAAGGRRRNVDRRVAEALVVLLRAGYTDAALVQVVLQNPGGVASAAASAAELLAGELAEAVAS